VRASCSVLEHWWRTKSSARHAPNQVLSPQRTTPTVAAFLPTRTLAQPLHTMQWHQEHAHTNARHDARTRNHVNRSGHPAAVTRRVAGKRPHALTIPRPLPSAPPSQPTGCHHALSPCPPPSAPPSTTTLSSAPPSQTVTMTATTPILHTQAAHTHAHRPRLRRPHSHRPRLRRRLHRYCTHSSSLTRSMTATTRIGPAFDDHTLIGPAFADGYAATAHTAAASHAP
jgi:hypothetical protein